MGLEQNVNTVYPGSNFEDYGIESNLCLLILFTSVELLNDGFDLPNAFFELLITFSFTYNL